MSALAPVSDFVRPDIKLGKHLAREALVGVSQCPQCRSIGTIVDLGACCAVSVWKDLGSLWDVPTPRDALLAPPAPLYVKKRKRQ